MKELISVIMPAYNAEKWIAEAIENICCQTYKNWELIIIDDGSTDRTKELCESYCTKDQRIRLFSQKNSGPSTARNYGLSKIRGAYFILVDSDDILYKNALEIYIRVAMKYHAETVVAGYRMVNWNNGGFKEFKFDKEEIFSPEKNLNTIEVEKLITSGVMASNWNKLYSSKLKHIRFNETLSINEDVLFSFTALAQSKVVAVIPDILYEYKIQNSASVSAKFHPEFPIALDILNQKLLSNQNDKLRLQISRWLMNYLHIHLRNICGSQDIRNKRETYLKEAVHSEVFKRYGSIKIADTKKRKAAVVLLKTHAFKLYIRLMQRKK